MMTDENRKEDNILTGKHSRANKTLVLTMRTERNKGSLTKTNKQGIKLSK